MPFGIFKLKLLFAVAKRYIFFSLFSLISSLEKSRGRFREKRKVKSEEYKKKKPLTRLFFLCYLDKIDATTEKSIKTRVLSFSMFFKY